MQSKQPVGIKQQPFDWYINKNTDHEKNIKYNQYVALY